MVWFSIITLTALNGVGLYYSVKRYYELKDSNQSSNSTTRTTTRTITDYDFRESMKNQLNSYLANQTTWLVFSIVCGCILTILILVLLYLRNRIRLAIALIIEASK